MKTTIKVLNITCVGCSNSMYKALSSINGIFGVQVDIPTCTVIVDHTDEVKREDIVTKLLALGYPEVGTAE